MNAYEETCKALDASKVTMVDVIKYVGETYGTALPFNSSYDNGTGYLDSMANIELENGIYFSSTFENRIILLIATDLGNLVMFQRHLDNEHVVVHNETYELRKLLDIAGVDNVMDKFSINNLIGELYMLKDNGNCNLVLASRVVSRNTNKH